MRKVSYHKLQIEYESYPQVLPDKQQEYQEALVSVSVSGIKKENSVCTLMHEGKNFRFFDPISRMGKHQITQTATSKISKLDSSDIMLTSNSLEQKIRAEIDKFQDDYSGRANRM
ncbi:hypothetical protein [uncultured Legionella sp.]|uniref:hypothetical protein n=1 Tax=uncultured Legionella sp. TaxID=210934 RepID=UPI0026256BA1|nr:hypothetical protein [uncultured Legionella sp.]